MLIGRGHHAMIEFGSIIVRFVTNRGVTHELVRHRLCSFAQESTRYVNYGGDDIQFIRPVWFNEKEDQNGAYEDSSSFMFERACEEAEANYKILLHEGWRPEQAREVLPNALKTEIVVQANVREWRHILKLRSAATAHPQMQALMKPLLEEMKEIIPVVFDDI